MQQHTFTNAEVQIIGGLIIAVSIGIVTLTAAHRAFSGLVAGMENSGPSQACLNGDLRACGIRQ